MIRSLIRFARGEERAMKGSTPLLLEQARAAATGSGEVLTVDDAVTLAPVWAAVRIISEAVASLPFNIVRIDKKGHQEIQHQDVRQKLFEISPNPALYSSYQWQETSALHMCFEGNAVTFIDTLRSDGKPDKLLMLDPRWVTDYYFKNGVLYYEISEFREAVPADRLIHIPWITYNGIWGMRPIEAHRKTFMTDKNSRDYSESFYRNGTFLSGVLSAQTFLDSSARKAIKEGLRQMRTGEVFIADQGMTFSPMSLSPVDAEWLKTRQNIREEVAMIYKIPLHMLSSAVDKPSYNSMEQLALEFRRQTIDPWRLRFESEYTRKMFSKREIELGYRVRADYTNWELADMKTLQEFLKGMFTIGTITQNEIRTRYLNLPAIESGDVTYVQGNNMIPSELAAEGAIFLKQQGQKIDDLHDIPTATEKDTEEAFTPNKNESNEEE